MIVVFTIIGGFIALLFFFFGPAVGFNILLLIVSVIIGLIYYFQNKLLYNQSPAQVPKNPSQNPSPCKHPSEQELTSIDVAIKTKDGLTIRGWHIKKQNAQQVLIYFHQSLGSICLFISKRHQDQITTRQQLVNRTNSEVILVAYRGYSQSEGTPSEAGIQKDAQAIMQYAIDYCQSKDPKMNIFLYGRALGGAVSIYLASHKDYKDKLQGLILENTFTSVSDWICDFILPFFKYMAFIQTNFWKSIDRVPQIQKPILFIRLQNDQIVPPMHTLKLYKKANKRIHNELYTIVPGNTIGERRFLSNFEKSNTAWEINKSEYFGKLNTFMQNPQVTGKLNQEGTIQLQQPNSAEQTKFIQ